MIEFLYYMMIFNLFTGYKWIKFEKVYTSHYLREMGIISFPPLQFGSVTKSSITCVEHHVTHFFLSISTCETGLAFFSAIEIKHT